jgi:hypothetical protein
MEVDVRFLISEIFGGVFSLIDYPTTVACGCGAGKNAPSLQFKTNLTTFRGMLLALDGIDCSEKEFKE